MSASAIGAAVSSKAIARGQLVRIAEHLGLVTRKKLRVDLNGLAYRIVPAQSRWLRLIFATEYSLPHATH